MSWIPVEESYVQIVLVKSWYRNKTIKLQLKKDKECDHLSVINNEKEHLVKESYVWIHYTSESIPALLPSRWDQCHSTRGSFYGSLDSRTGRCLFSKPPWQPESIFQAWDQIRWLNLHKYKNALCGRELSVRFKVQPWLKPSCHSIEFHSCMWLCCTASERCSDSRFSSRKTNMNVRDLVWDLANEIRVTLYMHRDSELANRGSFIFRLSLVMQNLQTRVLCTCKCWVKQTLRVLFLSKCSASVQDATALFISSLCMWQIIKNLEPWAY